MTRSASRAAARLDIRLLGPPEILVSGRPLAVDTRKAVAILALLAAEGRPFARDELAALLWPDSDDMAARGALRRTLSTMRAAIGDGSLVIDRARVDLDRRTVRVDLADVEAAARTTDRRALAAAAALARGTFMAGFNLRDSPDFDDWRAARAVSAERAVMTVLDRLGVAAEADGDLPVAIDAASRRLDLDPLDEGGHVRLMGLLASSGDRSGALRQYRACVATLERELGVAPLETTTARYEAIRDGPAEAPTTALSAPTSTQPTTPATGPAGKRELPVVGRDDAMTAIAAAHASVGGGRGRVVALVGEAGIGKTRVGAEAVARIRAGGGTGLVVTAYPAERSIAYGPVVDLLRAAAELPDGPERFQRLPAATRAELGRLLPSLDPGGAGPSPDGPGAHTRLVTAIAEALASLVSGPVPGTVWVDDVQWLDTASREALDFLLRRLERFPILLGLAWRPEDLDADGQAFVDRVFGSPDTELVALDRLGRSDIAALVASSSAGGRIDEELVDRLADASEGLPLYVVEVLAGGPGGGLGTLPRGVRSVLRERLATASETAGQVLAAASVIGRSFDLATVRHASGRTEEEAVDAIDEALRRGLIREAPTGFDFVHAALRDLAYESTSMTRRRLLHRRVAEALRLDLAGSGRDDLGRLVQVATHERAAGRDAEAAEAFRVAGQRAAEVYANHDAVEHFGAALALGHADVVGLHAEIGRLRTRLGDYAGAIVALESAAAGASPEGLPGLEWALARAHLRRGDLAAAEHHLDAAASGAMDDGFLARVWVDRSVVRRRAADPAGAAEAAREALALATRAADVVAAGAAHRMLGLAALDAGDAAGAIPELDRAVEAAEHDPDPSARIAALAALAMAVAATGDVDGATVVGGAALEACRRIGDRHLEAAVENHLADLLHAAGRDEAAMDHLRRAVAAFAEVGGDPADPDPGIWMLSAS